MSRISPGCSELMGTATPRRYRVRYKYVREEAVARLTDQAVLADFAKNDSDQGVRKEAVARLTDQVVLADIAKNDSDQGVRKKGVARLTDQAVLADFAKNDKDQA